MATYISDDPKLLDELFRKDGEGQLLAAMREATVFDDGPDLFEHRTGCLLARVGQQDREFFAAIREGREPNSSVQSVLPCYRVLHQLEQQLNAAA